MTNNVHNCIQDANFVMNPIQQKSFNNTNKFVKKMKIEEIVLMMAVEKVITMMIEISDSF